MERACEKGNLTTVKQLVSVGVIPTHMNYKVAVWHGHKDIVDYFHSLGMPDIRWDILMHLVRNKLDYLTVGALKAGAVPTELHVSLAHPSLVPMLQEAMRAEDVPPPTPPSASWFSFFYTA
jgi:hypothetical protein